MVTASGVSARIDAAAVPLLPGARALTEAGHVPGGTRRNREDAGDIVDWGRTDDVTRTLLADAQTSGGLLIALPPDAARSLIRDLATGSDHPGAAGGDPPAPAIIGSLEAGDGRIRIAGPLD
jgi:selenide, water dikinase